LNLLGCLRRLGEEWNYDNDYPCLPEDGVAYYKGMDLDEIAEVFGLGASELP